MKITSSITDWHINYRLKINGTVTSVLQYISSFFKQICSYDISVHNGTIRTLGVLEHCKLIFDRPKKSRFDSFSQLRGLS